MRLSLNHPACAIAVRTKPLALRRACASADLLEPWEDWLQYISRSRFGIAIKKNSAGGKKHLSVTAQVGILCQVRRLYTATFAGVL